MQTFPTVSNSDSRDPHSKQSQSWLVRRWRYYLYRLRRLRGGKQKIARGLAVGVFAGFFPLFGMQTLIGVLLATLIRGNKFAAAAATWISNPLTYVPIYAFNFHVGALLLRVDESLIDIDRIGVASTDQLLELGSALISTLFVGCLVTGLVAGICTYFLSLWLYARLRDRPLGRWRYRTNRHHSELIKQQNKASNYKQFKE
ncbi:DUF2062 domain-containing protein [Oscillatoria salina]|uniref:DUF2062 domain-containing protein n=1 Tax=Oscillatoria salina TaxID=331517 RepID=UPI0013BE24EB|nr:DUF2062 domain-containing protein [Oscillatoria salina]MBZ8179289.1 DUF2062 domain-containing protein [Oscillatoria salina IIICB1]NET86743.1 DUF2062 domain-containing protein [Kamptonema sp. SIO1D9]